MPRSETVGPSVVAFGRMVVDHVEDDLEAGGVQRPDHHLELADRVERRGRRRVGDIRGEVGQRVVAPVVAEAALHQVPVVRVVVDRHQLDRRHPQCREMPDRRLRGQAPVGPAQGLGDLRH